MRHYSIKQKVTIGFISSALIFTGIVASYAFFGTSGINNPEQINANTGSFSLTFADGNNSITQALEFGGSVEKTFSIQNTGSLDATARIMWYYLVNTYIDGSLTYTLSSSDTESGTFTNIVESQNVPINASTKELLAGNLTIPTGSTKYYKLTITLNYLDDVDQTSDLKASLSTHFSVEESDGKDILNAGIETTLARIGKNIQMEMPSFNQVATTNETENGLFSMEDDYGLSYYYRGAVEDNYVKFGTWKEGENIGKPMYWRIIRVNGDGSVRMIYDGTNTHTNGEASKDRLALTSVAWNTTNNNDAKYVGYMYGGTNGTASTQRVELGNAGYADAGNAIYNQTNTNIKTQIELWYSHNLSELDDYIEDVIYCNDRSMSEIGNEAWSGEGYGKNPTTYGAFNRYRTESNRWKTSNIIPNLKCKDKNDSFTKNENNRGNGKLNEKVGLITADELVTSGSGRGGLTNKNYYLYKGYTYWTMTPNYFYGSSSYNFFVTADGGFYHYDYINTNYNNYYDNSPVTDKNYVSPVISLTPEYFTTLIGDGTISNPFRAPNDEP